MIKKSLILSALFFIIFISVVYAENKIEIKPLKESFETGENITLTVFLYDAENNPINANLDAVLEDPDNMNKAGFTIPANRPIDINIGDKASFGDWKISVKYKDAETGETAEATGLIFIEANELANFNLNRDVLTITNIGNTKYTRTVRILIGETTGTKTLDLAIGEKINFRLIAPNGNYNVKITDGTATLTKSDVALTGNVIGILDERTAKRSPITGGANPEDESYLKKKNFVYIFIVIIVGVAVLLAIEKNYRRRAENK